MKQAELKLLAIRLPQIVTKEIDTFAKLQLLVEMWLVTVFQLLEAIQGNQVNSL